MFFMSLGQLFAAYAASAQPVFRILKALCSVVIIEIIFKINKNRRFYSAPRDEESDSGPI